MSVRLGAVSYLNTRPLVYGLDRARFAIRFDVPSRCATLLHDGEIDLGLIPSIEYQRGDYRIVSGVAIASHGPVASVALFSRGPVSAIRSVALDTSSRTSVALLQVLCAERFGIAPAFVPHGPNLPGMLAACDAALMIGDPALWTDPRVLGVTKTDLGAEWTAHTGLPFVWAVWAGRPGAIGPDGLAALARSRDEGVAAIDEIARGYAAGDEDRARRAAEYLRHNVTFGLESPHEEALRRFYGSAAKLGVVDHDLPPRFYGQVT